MTGDTRIGRAELGPLFCDRLRLSWNAMSPFAEALDAYVLGAGADEEAPRDTAAPTLDPEVAEVVARPDVRLTHRFAGTAAPPGAFTACCRRSAGERTVVVVPLPGGEYCVRSLETHRAYVAWWTSVLSSRVDRTGPNYLPSPVPLATLLLAFHAVDTYRRAKYPSDASHEPPPRLSIGIGEFAASMGAALATRNPQWLLPAMLLLTPGLDSSRIQLGADDLRALVAHAFIMRGNDRGTGEPTLSFGEAGERMGEEFHRGWALATGLEVAVWTSRGALPLYRSFLAPTTLANHHVQIAPWRDGVVAMHRVLTRRQLFATHVGVMSAAVDPAAPERAMRLADLRPVAPHEGRRPAPPAKTPPAKTPPRVPPTRGRRVTVREWFRMLWPAARGPCTPVGRTHVETLARLLRAVREQRLVSESEFTRLHAALRCRGPDRTLWTVGLGSLRWCRWAGGEWVACEPPDIVCIDASLALSFTRAREARAPRAGSGILDPFGGQRTRAAERQWSRR